MTWVKVCGLSRAEEIDTAAAAGADAVGFVSISDSPRFLDLDAVAALSASTKAGVKRILLTVDLDPEELRTAVNRTGVDGVQPYGRHALEAGRAMADAGLIVLFPVKPGQLPGSTPGIPIYDADVPGRLGGTGTTFDWSTLRDIEGDFVVAGGLGPDNVASLVEQVRPFGVDASSRLESSPGVKDLGKVAAFVREAKRT